MAQEIIGILGGVSIVLCLLIFFRPDKSRLEGGSPPQENAEEGQKGSRGGC